MDAAARERLARRTFRQIGMAFAETAWQWYRSPAGYAERFSIEGAEHLDAAAARGRGVILLQAHFTLIDLSGHAMCTRWPISCVYDPPKNPLYAAVQRRQRLRWMVRVIPNRDIRSMVRLLREGGIVWVLPRPVRIPGARRGRNALLRRTGIDLERHRAHAGHDGRGAGTAGARAQRGRLALRAAPAARGGHRHERSGGRHPGGQRPAGGAGARAPPSSTCGCTSASSPPRPELPNPYRRRDPR